MRHWDIGDWDIGLWGVSHGFDGRCIRLFDLNTPILVSIVMFLLTVFGTIPS